MFFVNERLQVIPDKLSMPQDFAALPPEAGLIIRDALVANVGLIEVFVAENPAQLSEDELEIVRSWRHMVAGRFYAFRELAKYTVFLSSSDPAIAYGVVALSQPFEDLLGPRLLVMTATVLLPFKGSRAVQMPGPAGLSGQWAASTFCMTKPRHRICGQPTSTTFSAPVPAAGRQS